MVADGREESIEVIFARLEEKYKSIFAMVTQLSHDHKEINKTIFEVVKANEKLLLLENNFQHLVETVDDLKEWKEKELDRREKALEQDVEDTNKRRKDLLWDIIKIGVIGGIAGLLSAMGFHKIAEWFK